MALDEFAGCSPCSAPAHHPDSRDTSQAPTGSSRGAVTRGFVSCQKRISGPPIHAVSKNQGPLPRLTSGRTAAQSTLTLCFQPHKCLFPTAGLLPALSTSTVSLLLPWRFGMGCFGTTCNPLHGDGQGAAGLHSQAGRDAIVPLHLSPLLQLMSDCLGKPHRRGELIVI